MGYNVLWTPDAQRDLDVAIYYLTETLGMSKAAARLLDDVERLITTLRSFSESHERVQDGLLAARGYRKAMVKPYVVLYLVDSSRQEVVITNIVHGSRDYAHLL